MRTAATQICTNCLYISERTSSIWLHGTQPNFRGRRWLFRPGSNSASQRTPILKDFCKKSHWNIAERLVLPGCREGQEAKIDEKFSTRPLNSTLCKLMMTFNSVHPPVIPVLQNSGGKAKRGKVHFPFASHMKKNIPAVFIIIYYHLSALKHTVYNSKTDSSLLNKFNFLSCTTTTHK